MWRYVALSAVLFSGFAHGEEQAQEAGTPPPPRHSGEASAEPEQLEPEITILRRDQDRIEEYRIGGQLYMIKVIPAKGFPYYLTDTDGDGQLETRRNDLEPNVIVPRWKIFSW